MDILRAIGLDIFQGRRRRRRFPLDFLDDDYFDSDDDDRSFGSSSDSDSYFDLLGDGKMDDRSKQHTSQQEKVESKPRVVSTLVDIAAKVTAQYYSCEALECNEPPLDESMLKKIAYLAFPPDEESIRIYARLTLKSDDEWKRGDKLFFDDRIQDIRQVGFMVSAIINKQLNNFCPVTKEDSRVSLTFEKQKITSTKCAMCPQVIWCQHIIGVIMHRIRKAEEVPLHAPVTETLSTLSRDQLQKLLQYAINADPGGILGRVFQHMDDVRDGNSDLNAIQGAPDPTFGVCREDSSVWEQSLKQLKKNLNDDCRFCRRNYPDTSNMVEKVKSSFYEQYLQRVVDLIGKKEVEPAGQVLNIIATSVYDVLSCQSLPSSMVLRFFLDIERYFSCFIVAHKGQARENMILTALKLNSKTKGNVDRYLKPSEWADISSVKLDDVVGSMNVDSSLKGQREGVLGANPEAPFYRAICASLIQDVPTALQDFYDGKDSLHTTTYSEPLPVMLLRFDGILCLESSRSVSDLCKLGIVILRQLLTMTAKLSVVGNAKQVLPVEDGPSDDRPSRPKRARVSRGKAKRKSSFIAAKKSQPLPAQEDSDMINGLSKPQIVYCLLYVCYSLYQTKEISNLDPHQTFILMNATLRAVELGRYRSVAPRHTIHSKDYSWLLFLENRIQESYLALVKSGNGGLEVSDLYSSALKTDGLGIYGDNIAVGLISLLEKQGDMDKETCIQLCVEAICHNSCPLKNLTVPEIGYGYRFDQSSLVMKWSSLVGSVFRSTLGVTTVGYKNVITRVLKHFVTVDDKEYVVAAYTAIRGYQMNLVEKEHKILLIKIVLRCIKEYATEGWTGFASSASCSYETLTKLGRQLELQFPSLILPVWQELCRFYKSSQLKGLIEVMKDTVCKDAILPAQMTNMLLKYFESKCIHDEECCELLHFFKVGDKGHCEALKKIAANAAQYTPRSLFLMAKRTYEEKRPSKAKNGQIFSKEVHLLVKLAFDRIIDVRLTNKSAVYPLGDSSAKNNLKWLCEKVAEDSCDATAKSAQFLTFIEKYSVCMKEDAEMLVIFLKAMECSLPMLEVAKQKLGLKLIESYQLQFNRELKNCSHTSYHRILAEMSKARQTCIQYVENGGDLFTTLVTDFVRKSHKGKKKLLKLMNEFFKT